MSYIGIDRLHDEADLNAGNRTRRPVLVLWSATGALPKLYGEVEAVWRPWADDLRGHGLDASHFLVEDEPEQVAEELNLLLREPPHDSKPTNRRNAS